MNKDKDGKIIVVGSTVRLPHKEIVTEFEDFVVVAVNRTAEKDDIRAVPVKALFACRALNAGQLLVIEDEGSDEELKTELKKLRQKAAEVSFSGERGGGKTSEGKQPEVETLSDSGPTLEKYIKAGYPKEGYPPKGYKAKDSPAFRELLKEREEAAKKAAPADVEKKLAEPPGAEQIPPA